MPMYRVACYQAGTWDGLAPRHVEADSETDAARKVCGEGLAMSGRPGELRALVSPVSDPNAKVMFYEPPEAA